VLFVAGARGDADVRTFVLQGTERLGETQALKLVREPLRPHGIRAEVWLDPAAQYLPPRVVQTPSGRVAAPELQREVQTPPLKSRLVIRDLEFRVAVLIWEPRRTWDVDGLQLG
jgi:hypothetical protein